MILLILLGDEIRTKRSRDRLSVHMVVSSALLLQAEVTKVGKIMSGK